MDEITDQKEAVSHSLSLTCPVGASGGRAACGPRLLTAAVPAPSGVAGLEIIKRALARHGECW